MTGPSEAPRMPRYGRESEGSRRWEPSAEDVARAQQKLPPNTILRVASVIPFVLVAVFGLIAVITWGLIVVLGLEAPGGSSGSEPIWRWAEGRGLGEIVLQVGLAIAIGLVPVAISVLAGWAVKHGFQEWPGRFFWPIAELLWGIAAIGLVVVAEARGEWFDTIGLSSRDWWFAFALVAYALIVARLRVRLERRARKEEG